MTAGAGKTRTAADGSPSEYVYAVRDDGTVGEFRITRRTPKRVYFEVRRSDGFTFEAFGDREAFERDGQAHTQWIPDIPDGWMYATRKAAGSKPRITRKPADGPAEAQATPPGDEHDSTWNDVPAGSIVPVPKDDSTRNDDGQDGDLWAELAHGDWSSSAAAYATATTARRILGRYQMTRTAFAAECKRKGITGWQSQGSVSRRLRWADLHDKAWEAGILPRDVFLSEAATRPLFDGKLTPAQRIQLLAELFGPHLTEEQKRKLAADLSEALMREHLARHGDSGPEYKAPRVPVLETTVAKLLVHYPAEAIHEAVDRLDNSARNAAGRGA